MKKIFVLLYILIFMAGNASFADGDLWDNFGDQNVYGQQPVTDEDFEKALESKKGKKKRDKNIPKGEEFRQSNETDSINQMPETLPVVCVSAPIKLSEDAVLPVGHYQAKGELKNGTPVIKLYQSKDLMAEIPAVETNDDFNEPEVNFIKMIDAGNDNQVKFIFGSMDFNAYAVMDIAPEGYIRPQR